MQSAKTFLMQNAECRTQNVGWALPTPDLYYTDFNTVGAAICRPSVFYEISQADIMSKDPPRRCCCWYYAIFVGVGVLDDPLNLYKFYGTSETAVPYNTKYHIVGQGLGPAGKITTNRLKKSGCVGVGVLDDPLKLYEFHGTEVPAVPYNVQSVHYKIASQTQIYYLLLPLTYYFLPKKSRECTESFRYNTF